MKMEEYKMEHVQFITFQGKRILLVDMSNAQQEDALAILSEAKKVIGTQLPQSLLTLTDVSEMRYNVAVAQAFKDLSVFDKPIVRAAAVVGVDGLMKIMLNGIIKVSSRQFGLFDSREQAQEWLIKQ
jgi:hypothetical protein